MSGHHVERRQVPAASVSGKAVVCLLVHLVLILSCFASGGESFTLTHARTGFRQHIDVSVACLVSLHTS